MTTDYCPVCMGIDRHHPECPEKPPRPRKEWKPPADWQDDERMPDELDSDSRLP
jgi:hypothetical protein